MITGTLTPGRPTVIDVTSFVASLAGSVNHVGFMFEGIRDGFTLGSKETQTPGFRPTLTINSNRPPDCTNAAIADQ
ncbi:hypothetical protein MJD09_16925, partial [bacterium]|nr:hypothetical protein [bacterium]